MMRQTGIPLFRVKLEEFQSSLSAVRTMCHPVRTPICLLSAVRTMCHSVQTSDRQASPIRMTCFFRPDTYIVSRSFCTNLLRPDISAACPNAYQISNGSLILSKVSRKGRSINRPNDVVSRPDAYLRKARIAVQNEPSGHLTAVVRTLVHRIW
jgi:hypothetical protein